MVALGHDDLLGVAQTQRVKLLLRLGGEVALSDLSVLEVELLALDLCIDDRLLRLALLAYSLLCLLCLARGALLVELLDLQEVALLDHCALHHIVFGKLKPEAIALRRHAILLRVALGGELYVEEYALAKKRLALCGFSGGGFGFSLAPHLRLFCRSCVRLSALLPIILIHLRLARSACLSESLLFPQRLNCIGLTLDHLNELSATLVLKTQEEDRVLCLDVVLGLGAQQFFNLHRFEAQELNGLEPLCVLFELGA